MTNHKWKEVEVPENLKDTFKQKFICVRGECGTVKLVAGSNYTQYTRDRHFYSRVPDCHGDIPLNKQPID